MEDQARLKTNNIVSFLTGLFSPGLGRTLLFRFVIISVLPMIFIAWVSIQNSMQSITQDQTDKLTAVAQAKLNHLSSYFDSTITNIRLQAELDNTVNFLQAMKQALQSAQTKKSNKSLKEVTNGYQWAALEEEYGSDFSQFLTTYDYIDILLLDTDGNVLYSIRRDSDFGTNVFSTGFNGQFFSDTARKALSTGIPVYSDMQHYAPYDNQVASFLMQAVVDEYGDKLGVLAIHLSTIPIQNIMQQSTGLGNSGETFLVGNDLLMRSNSRFSQTSDLLLTKVENKTSLLWQQQLKAAEDQKNNTKDKTQLAMPSLQKIELYRGYHGEMVYGVQLNVEFSGVPMLLKAELTEAEALLPMQALLFRVFWVVIISLIIVLIFSIFSARAITKPITKLTIWARRLADGHLVKENVDLPNNEIGELNNSFSELVDSFQEVTAIMEALSVGDLTKSIYPRSKDDVLVQTLNQLNSAMQGVVDQAEYIANGNYDVMVAPRSERDTLGTSLELMTTNLRTARQESLRQNWLKTSQAEIAEILSGDNEVTTLANELSNYFSSSFNAHVAVLYTIDTDSSDSTLNFTGGFAFGSEQQFTRSLKFGETLVGQCAANQRILILENSPDDYLKISSALGETSAKHVVVAPFITNKLVKGVIEIGGLKEFNPDYIELLRLSSDAIAVAFDFCWTQNKARKLLLKTQQQQTDLADSNDTLLEQTQQLKKSEIELKEQSTTLSEINKELLSRGEVLERQKTYLEKAKKETDEKAIALEEASKYKSEFLANMSHELRTPLNSLLILAGILAKNEDGNLTLDDVESAEVIQESGKHLLELINEILDLSKVESGQMTLIDDEINITSLAKGLNSRFSHMAQAKSLDFKVSIDKDLPDFFISDEIKLIQVINNLTSNAIKFTEAGTVEIAINKQLDSNILPGVSEVIAFTVIDSGMGIEEDKHRAIFEAFQQADGSTSRTHGGTGLGLSIALSFAHLLGGDIRVESEVGKGSRFSLYLPLNKSSKDVKSSSTSNHVYPNIESNKNLHLPSHSLVDDRAVLMHDKKLLLIVEDDPSFAKIVFNECHKQNCQAIVAVDGETGLQLVNDYKFDGIILDYMLPGIDGGHMLMRIKENPASQHIPVHIVSALDNLGDLRALGAIDQAVKPISHKKMAHIIQSLGGDMPAAIHVLIVEDDPAALYALKRLLSPEGVNITGVNDALSALKALESALYDIMILDLGLPDFSGIDLLELIDEKRNVSLPKVVIHTGRDITESEREKLARFTDRIVIKSTHSHERLLDELHNFIAPFANATAPSVTELKAIPASSNNPPIETQPIAPVTPIPAVALIPEEGKHEFADKSVLLVDDDMRNTFALAKVLRKYKLNVRIASSGAQSLSALEEFSDIDLVLMDIMMPEMDGYEAIKRIRDQTKFEHLTIIAVTANAMPGDDQLCFKAGANDYISKPVDVEHLTQLLRKYL